MKRIAKKILTVTLATLLTFVCLLTYAEETAVNLESVYFDMVLENIIKNYKFEADAEAVVGEIASRVLAKHPEMLEELIDATASQLDRNTDYYTPEELEAFTTYFNAEYVGIGVTVQRMVGSVGVVSVMAGSTAEAAGVLPGDRFLRVNGQDVTDFAIDDLTALVKGEAGTEVQLTLLRDGRELTFTIVRAAVNAPTVAFEKLENGIGYMQIASFNSNTAGEIGAVDAYCKENKIKKLIIDLRDNPGGELASVVNALGYFVPRGKDIVSIEYRNDLRNTTLRSVGIVGNKPYYTKLVVLINESSASAAELFAGNIRDHQLGTLVGVTSFGKGTVQDFLNLPNLGEQEFGAIKLTTAEYILPGGECIHEVGIKPDYWEANRKVRLDTSKMEAIDYMKDYQEGDSGPGVLALKQRFHAVDYFVGELNDKFDRELTISVKAFQKACGMEPTGVMNLDTLRNFTNYVDGARVLIDEQFNKALELIKA